MGIQVSADRVTRCCAFEMEVASLLFVLTTTMLGSTQSAIVPGLPATSYDYPSAGIALEPAHHVQLASYQDSYSPYVLYNILGMNTDLKPVPAPVFAHGKPMVQHIPTYNYGYYGTPVYDFRLPLQPVYPVLHPTQAPLPLPKPTAPPSTPIDVDDGIEKLDQKVEPDVDKKEPLNHEETMIDDDTVAVDAI